MKWFQTDSDWPDDDRIERIVAGVEAAPGEAGPKKGWIRVSVRGVLATLWALAAQQDKAREPGYLEQRPGQPIGTARMARYCDVPEPFVVQVLTVAAAEGHILHAEWTTDRLVVFPGLKKRADIYTQRKLLRQGQNSGQIPVRTPVRDQADIPVDVKGNQVVSNKTQEDSGLFQEPDGPDQVAAVVEVWNTHTTAPIPKVDLKRLSADRRRKILAALKVEPNLDEWKALVGWVDRTLPKRPGFLVDGRRNPGYQGSHPDWTANIDWLIRPGMFQRQREEMQARGGGYAGTAPKYAQPAGKYAQALNHGTTEGDRESPKGQRDGPTAGHHPAAGG